MVQEVTTQSWFSRIIGALWGIIIGLILMIGACVLIFWNEGHGLHVAQALTQAEKVLIVVPNSPVNSQNNHRVISFDGMAATKDILHDSLLDTSQNAIQLNRTVEMYQWKEEVETKTEKQLGGSETETKTYSYHPVWSESIIDSSEFKESNQHQNPASMPIKSKRQYAKTVMVGDFYLPSELITQISGDTYIDLAKIDLTNVKNKLNKPVQAVDESLYVGKDPESPEVGDIKIKLSAVLSQTVSIIAQQQGNTLQAYIAPSGQPVELLMMGERSPQEILQKARTENTQLMWVFRLISLAMMVSGMMLLLRLISVLADIVPFFGSIVAAGTGLISFVVGFSLWLIAMIIAWFAARPVVGFGLVLLVIVICFLLLKIRRGK